MAQSVQRAIDVLELVSLRPCTVSDVAGALGVHRTTALRLLQTLADGGLARRQEDGRYGVGYRLAGLAALALEQFDLRALARPHLEQLGDACSHTVHLAALEGGGIVYVDKVEPVRGPRLSSQIGRPVCLHTAGVSKAILAHQSDSRLRELLAGCAFERYTSTTITSREAFLRELAATRDRGWSTDDGELEDYVTCLGAPVRDSMGGVTAAVSVTALRAGTDLAALQDLVPRLLDAAGAISKELGWRP